MTSHKDCTHPKTKAGRASCRKKLDNARLAGLEIRAKIDKAHTVRVEGEEIILPFQMAWELKKPAPHPRRSMGDEYGENMLRRQQLRKDCAELLGIPVSEVPKIIRQLRDQDR